MLEASSKITLEVVAKMIPSTGQTGDKILQESEASIAREILKEI